METSSDLGNFGGGAKDCFPITEPLLLFKDELDKLLKEEALERVDGVLVAMKSGKEDIVVSVTGLFMVVSMVFSNNFGRLRVQI